MPSVVEKIFTLLNCSMKKNEVVMARITCEDCLEKVGKQNRFKLIHLTVQRVKQHRQGNLFSLMARIKKSS